MSVYGPDSTVSAAILCEYGVWDPNLFSFTWVIRYKIFKREGLDYLILSVPVSNKGGVKGMVFNMEGKKITKSKLTRESIYQERVIGGYTRLRVAPPDAREGSVVDISFTMNSLPSIWRFQKEIPVLWSELVIPPSQYVTFNKRFQGFEGLYQSSSSRWVAKDMPPFHAEPYINSRYNYMTAILIELAEINIPPTSNSSGYYRSYATSWDQVADYFNDDPDYGVILRSPDLFLNEAAENIRASSTSEEELVINALQHIRGQVRWDETEDLYPSSKLKSIYQNDHVGTAADMNFLFLKLLDKLDVESYPMVMSLRNEGFINPMFPSISKFNYTVSYVKIGDQFKVIDAADKYYPYDLLNRNCLNSGGFLLKKEGGEWVEIKPGKSEENKVSCTLAMSQDGILEGALQLQHVDYASTYFRKEQEEYSTDDEYLEAFEKENPSLMVLDYSKQGQDQEGAPVTETMEIEIDGNLESAGESIILDPIVIGKMEENPFKLEKREYPVDFGHGLSESYFMSVILPEGYEITQMPEPIQLVTTDKSGIFQYQAAQNGNMLQVMYRLSINKPVFLQEEYLELKTFFSLVVQKQSEPVVITKSQP